MKYDMLDQYYGARRRNISDLEVETTAFAERTGSLAVTCDDRI